MRSGWAERILWIGQDSEMICGAKDDDGDDDDDDDNNNNDDF